MIDEGFSTVNVVDSEARRSVSVVVPVFNEVENVLRLAASLQSVLGELQRPWEVIVVDDGSTDGTAERLESIAAAEPRWKVVTLGTNCGQTAALRAGIELASGDFVALMDGDLQNDPADLPMMFEKLSEGYDLVHGWRKNRHDRWLDRRLPSMFANRLISLCTRYRLHDTGCTLKVMRREVACNIPLFGGMHRFIPALAASQGARCVEVVVRHHPRRFGQSKYGLSRIVRVLRDLVTVSVVTRFQSRFFQSRTLVAGAVAGLTNFDVAPDSTGTATSQPETLRIAA